MRRTTCYSTAATWPCMTTLSSPAWCRGHFWVRVQRFTKLHAADLGVAQARSHSTGRLACAGSVLLAGLSAPAALLFSALGFNKGAAQYAVRAALVRSPSRPLGRQQEDLQPVAGPHAGQTAGPGLRAEPRAPALGC